MNRSDLTFLVALAECHFTRGAISARMFDYLNAMSARGGF